MDRKTADGNQGVSEELRCPECGSADVGTRLERQQFPYGEGREAAELEALLPVRRCSRCAFEFLDDCAEAVRHEAVCRHLGVLTPDQIRELRGEYGLSRAEFSRVTRLGEATLSRWESGTVIQNAAYDRYLRLLRFPENIRRLQIPASNSSSGSLVSMAAYRFRALRDEDSPRRQQANFQLRKRASG